MIEGEEHFGVTREGAAGPRVGDRAIYTGANEAYRKVAFEVTNIRHDRDLGTIYTVAGKNADGLGVQRYMSRQGMEKYFVIVRSP